MKSVVLAGAWTGLGGGYRHVMLDSKWGYLGSVSSLAMEAHYALS